MEVYWKLIIDKDDIVLVSFFQKERDVFEIKMDLGFLKSEDVSLQKTKIYKNGVEISDYPDSEFSSIKEMLYEKKKIFTTEFLKQINLLLKTDVVPLIIFNDNEVINIALQGKGFVVEFDYTFQAAMKKNTFMEAIAYLKDNLEKNNSGYPEQRVITRDAVLFEEYLIIGADYCSYFGFIDNEKAETPQEIFRMSLTELKILVSILISVNERLKKQV